MGVLVLKPLESRPLAHVGDAVGVWVCSSEWLKVKFRVGVWVVYIVGVGVGSDKLDPMDANLYKASMDESSR